MYSASTGCGTFISLEGIDGAGKTTIAHQVVHHLAAHGLPAVLAEKNSGDFADPYVHTHSTVLSHLIWETAPDSPLYMLGDDHWFHLIAGWFALLDHCRISPLLREGKVVISDGWYFKYLARFKLKGHYDMELAYRTFEKIIKPDQVFLMEIDVEEAARRKHAFSAGETGAMDDKTVSNIDGFKRYQRQVQDVLHVHAERERWHRVTCETRAPNLIACEIATRIIEHLRIQD